MVKRKPTATKKGKKAAARKTQKSTKQSAASAVVDVRDKKDVSKLLDIIKGNKVTLVLIYADWCGHCKTFKQEVWSKLKGLKDRKLPLAEVNADVLGETPLANAKIDGYPSVVPIGSDMKMATLKTESGESTNALPNARDENMMKALVSSDANKVLSGNKAGKNNANTSKTLTAEAEEELRQSTDKLIQDLKTQTSTNVQGTSMPPPSTEDDLIASQGVAPEELSAVNEAAAPAAEAPVDDFMPEAEAAGTAAPEEPGTPAASSASSNMKGGKRGRATRKRHSRRRRIHGALYEYLAASRKI